MIARALAAVEAHTEYHDLRHSCATLLIAQGVNHRVVMDILGHTQISTTMNTYAHVLPATQRQAVEEIDKLLGDAPAKEDEDEDEDEEEEEGAGDEDEEGAGD